MQAPQPSGSPIRVVVGDDDPLYQVGITQVLREAGVDVVASASTADTLARKVRAHHPDVAIVELGSNDALRGQSPAQTEKNLAQAMRISASTSGP